eukprot:TRINITY_DN30092_c0_g1_i1.p1 TRINITY_DN30092_c0_g1~~TRINITY_DN30092_c0_g1_i1.p1  ORF type:complete len:887 (+),score=182.53 TRINITY_DN30092_c0_g1_i1:108-2768(+)
MVAQSTQATPAPVPNPLHEGQTGSGKQLVSSSPTAAATAPVAATKFGNSEASIVACRPLTTVAIVPTESPSNASFQGSKSFDPADDGRLEGAPDILSEMMSDSQIDMPILKQVTSIREAWFGDCKEAGDMPKRDKALLFILMFLLGSSLLVIFSGMFEQGYETYQRLLALYSIRRYFVGAGFIAWVSLHAMNWYDWKGLNKAPPALLTMLLAGTGITCYAKAYPAAPLIFYFMLYPVVLGALRAYCRSRTTSHSFYLNTAVALYLLAFFALVVWLVWIFVADLPWGLETKATLRGLMGNVFKQYDLVDWPQCEQERALPRGADAVILKSCSRVELITFIVWISPMCLVTVATTLASFCLLRRWMLGYSRETDKRAKAAIDFDLFLKLVVLVVSLLSAVAWVACSIAGASMNLSQVMLSTLAAAGFVFCVWLLLAVNLKRRLKQANDSVIFKIVQPAFQSDYFVAFMLCMTHGMIVGFIALEFCIRQGERLLGREGFGERYLTQRGQMLVRFITEQHGASVLEKSYQWCMMYLVFFYFSRFTPAFLVWLGDILLTTDFGYVCVVFYIVGITMFLLPPVPGVPVYLAAGSIIVTRGKLEPWLDFYGSLLFASMLSLILKLNAVALQQKVIGECMGSGVYIRQLVGCHSVSIRAIEKILRKPGLTVEKVCILCGGPDWPTSVLTGILRLDVVQMTIGTLPCLLLIIPCVLGGASLTEKNLQSLSAMIITLVGLSQGGVMLSAMVFIAKEAERSNEELSAPRPEDAVLMERAKKEEELANRRKNATLWAHLSWMQRICLILASVPMLNICWVAFWWGSQCFRTFQIGDDIDASFDDGGLEGDVFNLVQLGGKLITFVVCFSTFFYIVYGCITRQKVRTQPAKVEVQPQAP